MTTIGILVLALLGLALALGFVAALVSLVVHIVLLPFTVGWWLLKGAAGLVLGLLGLLLGLGVLLLLVPTAVAFVLLPLLVPALLVWLIVRIARRHRAVRA